MNNENVVISENLYKHFIVNPGKKKIDALTNINIEIPVGKLTALIGPDGAGKTTFMRLICGLMMPSEGNITVLGINTKENPQGIQDRISYMPQRFGLYEDLSIHDRTRRIYKKTSMKIIWRNEAETRIGLYLGSFSRTFIARRTHCRS